MLIIRREQMRAMADELDRCFYAGLARWAQDQFSDLLGSKTPDEVLRHVRAITDRAIAFGLRGEDDVHAFLRLELESGPAFEDKAPWIRGVLGDGALTGEARIKMVLSRMEANR